MGLFLSWCPPGNVQVHHQASRTLGNGSNGVNKSILTVLLSMSARVTPVNHCCDAAYLVLRLYSDCCGCHHEGERTD